MASLWQSRWSPSALQRGRRERFCFRCLEKGTSVPQEFLVIPDAASVSTMPGPSALCLHLIPHPLPSRSSTSARGLADTSRAPRVPVSWEGCGPCLVLSRAPSLAPSPGGSGAEIPDSGDQVGTAAWKGAGPLLPACHNCFQTSSTHSSQNSTER